MYRVQIQVIACLIYADTFACAKNELIRIYSENNVKSSVEHINQHRKKMLLPNLAINGSSFEVRFSI